MLSVSYPGSLAECELWNYIYTFIINRELNIILKLYHRYRKCSNQPTFSSKDNRRPADRTGNRPPPRGNRPVSAHPTIAFRSRAGSEVFQCLVDSPSCFPKQGPSRQLNRNLYMQSISNLFVSHPDLTVVFVSDLCSV